jgi:small basic protein
MIFGKRLSEYIRFQQGILGLILVVGLAKLAMTLAGMPNSTTKWLSLTVLTLVGVFYYGVRVHTSGFGSYKQMLPLIFNQNVVAHAIVIIGIVIGIVTGHDNVFTAPEYSGGGDGKTWPHVGAHVVLGMFVGTLVGWLVASIVMWVTKRVARRPAPAVA